MTNHLSVLRTWVDSPARGFRVIIAQNHNLRLQCLLNPPNLATLKSRRVVAPMAWFPTKSTQLPFQVRPARRADADDLARIYVDSWRLTYKGLIPQDYLDNLSYRAFANHWRKTIERGAIIFKAEVGGEVSGVASAGKCRWVDLASGEIRILYVSRLCHGSGLGRALFDACHFELARRGLGPLLVRVLEGNDASGFYEHLGGTFAGTKDIRIAGRHLKDRCYVWQD